MFFIWNIAQYSFLLIFAVLFISQIIMPPFLGKPYFWLFRKATRKSIVTLDELETEEINYENRKLSKKVDRIKEK